jgi:DNA ligase (NAD+)
MNSVKKASDSFLKEKSDETLHNIQEFKKNGMTFLETLNQTDLDHMIVKLNHVYYNTKESLLTDNEYDIVKEYIMKTYPDDKAIEAIGAPIISEARGKANLPYEMWSMDKIKPDSGELAKWTNKFKGPYTLSWKLDGISGLYCVNNGKGKLYTRGDGKVGQDISHLIPVLNLPFQANDMVVRGEFILNKNVFKSKYADKFANPRNMVAGIVNSNSVSETAKDLHFVAYECIVPDVKPSEQFQLLKDAGFEVVENKSLASINNELLSEYLVDNRDNPEYEIDGIIVSNDGVYERNSGNPEHAFAFKMVLSDQKAEAKVVDVLWEASKDGLLKPRVRIEPVKIGGVTIQYITGNNAKYIRDNQIGIGAIVELIRSGDVIPKITRVIVKAASPKLPNEQYTWTETGVDIQVDNMETNTTVLEKNITAFFTELEVDGLKAGNVKKIMDAGFGTIPKILKMTTEDFQKVGFKSTAAKYVTNIKQKVDDASLTKLMVASGLLGRGIGERKIAPLVESFPDIQSITVEQAKSVTGIELKTATTIVENIPKFLLFVKECQLDYKLLSTSVKQSSIKEIQGTIVPDNALKGKKIVMTKVRDKDIINALSDFGATLEDNMKKDVFVLIVKTKDDVSNKTKYAVENNIPIMTPDEFKQKYMTI